LHVFRFRPVAPPPSMAKNAPKPPAK
jgi:hypothetical protein